MSVFIGHHDVVALLMSQIKTFPHGTAWLFTGSAGLGKSRLACIISYFLTQDLPIDTTDTDRILRENEDALIKHLSRVTENQIPSIKYLKRTAGHDIDIAQIRDLSKFLSSTPGIDKGKRVVIIDDFHYLNQAVQNALLKMLEEKLHNTYFILIVPETSDILPTVASRCIAVPFHRLSSTNIEDIFRRLNMPLGDDKRINDTICHTGDMQFALLLYEALRNDLKVWRAHADAWMHFLRKRNLSFDLAAVIATSSTSTIHVSLFFWQLMRIYHFVSGVKVDNIAICEREKELWQLSKDYPKECWQYATYKARIVLLDPRCSNIPDSDLLSLLFGCLSDNLFSQNINTEK